MLSNQIIQTNIDELKGITKVDFFVYDMEGVRVACTSDELPFDNAIIDSFINSPADSQIVSGCHFLKVMEEHEPTFVLVAKGFGDDAYMMGKVAVCQIQNLLIAYKDRFDRTGFFQRISASVPLTVPILRSRSVINELR
jgi:carbohydrate diacid regulator